MMVEAITATMPRTTAAKFQAMRIMGWEPSTQHANYNIRKLLLVTVALWLVRQRRARHGGTV